MDIFQTTITSLKIIYAFVDGCASFSKDAAGLSLRLKYDGQVLQNVLEFFDLRRTNQELSPADQELITELSTYLTVFLEGVNRVAFKMQSKGFPRIWVQATWALRRHEIEKLSDELHQWTQRFDVRVVALPAHLKAIVDLQNVPDAERVSPPPGLYVQRRVEEARAAKRSMDANALRCLPSDINLGARIDRKLDSFLATTQDGNPAYVEYYAQSRLLEAKEACVELATVLHLVNPQNMGILKCAAYFVDDSRDQYGLVYEIPAHFAPPPGGKLRTLKSLFEETKATGKLAHSLNERYTLATSIATALLYVHSVNWVHKSLRSDNILILEKNTADKHHRYPYTLGSPFLVGFPYARQEAAESAPVGLQEPSAPTVDLYRHPDRQGAVPAERFSMSHDVYSLGVVLLEIGRWQALDSTPAVFEHKSPEEVKGMLRTKARGVAVTMGRKYSDVVAACLQSGDGGQVGSAKYVQEILGKLEELSSAMN